MTKLQYIRTTLAFLNRTPIEGQEAEAMVLCKQWLRSQEQLALRSPEPTTSGTGVQQVADTIEK